MIDVLAVDRWSSRGHGWLHRASAGAKIAAAAACIGALIISRDVAVLGLIYAGLLAALLTSGLPIRPVLALSALPLAMSAVFAVTRLGGTWESAIAIVEKGAITSLVLLLLVGTTPATELFSVLRRVMPRTLAEMLFLGYRSIFLLLARALAAREAVRLRSPRLSLAAGLKRNATVGALAVLRASELAADQYAAMRLRGLGSARDASGRVRTLSGDGMVLALVGTLLAGATVLARTQDAERSLVLGSSILILAVSSGVGRWRTQS